MKSERLNLNDYDYALPPALIATHPLPQRDACRLLVVERLTRTISHRRFSDLPRLLKPSDLLVVNNTKVIWARLRAQRASGGAVEILLHREVSPGQWEALLKPANKCRVGETLTVSPRLSATITAKKSEGQATLKLAADGPRDEILARVGHVPLPPYLHRADTPADRRDYQTIFARKTGAVAAPTAGLHFTPALRQKIRRRGLTTAAVTLHVGRGTFQPLRAQQLATGRLHPERFAIPPSTAAALAKTKAAGGRVVAVGTTVARTLEHVARGHGGRVVPERGETDLFITPGFRFQVVDSLITNFHLPRSSLFLLVCAFAGRELILRAYREAIRKRYRFYSYGDAMVIG